MSSFFNELSFFDFLPLFPIAILLGTGLCVLLLGTFSKKSLPLDFLSILFGIVSSACLLIVEKKTLIPDVLMGAIESTPLTRIVSIFILIATGAIIILSRKNSELTSTKRHEFLSVLLLTTSGMLIMLGANNFIALFLGIEIMSIGAYILTGMTTENKRSIEAATKYLILGAFSTGLFLYGTALIFGATGSFIFSEISPSANVFLEPTIYYLGFGLVITSMCFKIAAVPFHMWAPDVYDGAPTPVSGYMATLVKSSAFIALLKLLLVNGTVIDSFWMPFLFGISFMTMLAGNVAALKQKTVKRLLAYSSVAHAGYLLIAVLASTALPNDAGVSSLVFYLITYTVTTIGAFAILTLFKIGHIELRTLAGLSQSHPGTSFLLSLFLLSLAGIPPTAGFIAKYYIFSAAIDSGLLYLVIAAIINSVIGVFYYLKPIVLMYFQPQDDVSTLRFSLSQKIVLAICAALVMLIGLLPSTLLNWAQETTLAFM